MLKAPPVKLTAAQELVFRSVLDARNPDLLPADLPRWIFLHWLAARGWLLHGSPVGGLSELKPLAATHLSPDDFSNLPGVYATSDGLWPLMYALRGPGMANKSDMALQLRLPDGSWSETRYFLSLAARESGVTDARSLLAPGFVYVLAREGFEQSPAHEHPGLGYVQETHWASLEPVRPLLIVPVTPDDFPLPVRLHDAQDVRARSEADPWGFPWLPASEQRP